MLTSAEKGPAFVWLDKWSTQACCQIAPADLMATLLETGTLTSGETVEKFNQIPLPVRSVSNAMCGLIHLNISITVEPQRRITGYLENHHSYCRKKSPLSTTVTIPTRLSGSSSINHINWGWDSLSMPQLSGPSEICVVKREERSTFPQKNYIILKWELCLEVMGITCLSYFNEGGLSQ